MDVSVKDVDEIVRFANSTKGFLSDYLSTLTTVGSRAANDASMARNMLQTIRNRADSAERDMRSAESKVDDAVNRANRYPEEDHEDDIRYAIGRLEEANEAYQRAKAALEEAEVIAKKVTHNADRVQDEVNHARRQIQSTGQDALKAIQTSARKIAQYLRK